MNVLQTPRYIPPSSNPIENKVFLNKGCGLFEEQDILTCNTLEQLAKDIYELEQIQILCRVIKKYANPDPDLNDNEEALKVANEILSELECIEIRNSPWEVISEKLRQSIKKVSTIIKLQMNECILHANEELKELPESFNYLVGLNYLELRANDLTTLPNLNNLKKLIVLDIKGNENFAQLPSFLNEMAFHKDYNPNKALKRLVISNTNIKEADSRLKWIIDPACRIKKWLNDSAGKTLTVLLPK